MSQEETMQDELNDLQAEIDELESNFETCQDALADMTRMRDNLAEALAEAIGQLNGIYDSVTTRDLDEVYAENS